VFTRIEAKNYRCLKEVSQPLDGFEILVGPNGGGKSTFLDVVGFLSDFVSDGVEAAVERRTDNFQNLVYGVGETEFRLSVVCRPPGEFLSAGNSAIRYDVLFGLNPVAGKFAAEYQYLSHIPGGSGSRPYEPFYSSHESTHRSILNDAFQLYAPVAWLRNMLREDIRTVELDTHLLKRPSPAGSAGDKRITGAGLARLIENLKSMDPDGFQDWLSHVQTALPEIRTIRSMPREWENSRYVVVQYSDNVQVPSWMLSEGTLRLLQLTILAYLPDFHGVYLIEEPENGVHPSALETIYQSLSSIYGAQVLVSSHSPILLNMAKPEQLLCFSKSPEGIKIVRGNEHPALKDWQNEVSLGTLAASGILG